MSGRNGYGPGLHEPTAKPDVELGDDQAIEGRGESSGRKGPRRRNWTNGRSRNLVIPDSLYDALFIYARKTKVKTTSRRKVNGVVVGTKEGSRSLTASEAACHAIADFLKKKGMLEDDEKPPAE